MLSGLIQVPVARGDRPVYVISIAASLAGCHPRTLRIYEEEGLLEPVRTETNIRLYSDDDLRKVRCIRYLTKVRGVNLAGVKLLMRYRGVDDLVEELAEAEDRGDGEYGGAPRGTTRF
jgi:MerR family transcriptional regulator/heat shock protein HspR